MPTVAELVIGTDNDVAYASLYDAARKAVSAHMAANGLRAKAVPGAHHAVGVYAAERVPDATGAVGQFQRMRQRRNRSEYGDAVFGDQDVTADLAVARAIVAAVRAAL